MFVEIRVSYLTALPDYHIYMHRYSALMNKIREHKSWDNCLDCARFIDYYEDGRYSRLPKVPSCPKGIGIVKHYFQSNNQRWPQAAKLAEGSHRPHA